MGGQDNEPQFVDADTQWQNPKETFFDFKIIAMRHLERIVLVGSKEFRGGYWREESSKSERGVTIIRKVYEPDSREEYCNAIAMLYDLIMPKIEAQNDKRPAFQDVKKEIKKILKSIDSARKECLNRTEKNDSEILPTEFYGLKDKEVIETYKHRNLRLHRLLFQELNKYMNLQNYFTILGIDD